MPILLSAGCVICLYFIQFRLEECISNAGTRYAVVDASHSATVTFQHASA